MKHKGFLVIIILFLLAVTVDAQDTKLTKSWINMTLMDVSCMKLHKNADRIQKAFAKDATITVFIRGVLDDETYEFGEDKTLSLTPKTFVDFLNERSQGNRLFTLSRKKIWSMPARDGQSASTHSFLVEGSLASERVNRFIAEDATVKLINGKARITLLTWDIME